MKKFTLVFSVLLVYSGLLKAQDCYDLTVTLEIPYLLEPNAFQYEIESSYCCDFWENVDTYQNNSSGDSISLSFCVRPYTKYRLKTILSMVEGSFCDPAVLTSTNAEISFFDASFSYDNTPECNYDYYNYRITKDFYFTVDYLPTCADGIQNQDETGIDCGGSCDCPSPNWDSAPWSPQPPSDMNITYAEACNLGGAQSLDYDNNAGSDCLISGTINATQTGSFDACSGGTITRKWEVVNDCGETLLSHTQTITVAPEPNPSWLSLPDTPESLTANKADSFSIPSMTITNGINSGDCTRSDQVSGSPTNEYNITGGIKILSWSNTDECGRSLTHKDTIQVTRIPKANWTSTLPQNTSISYAEAEATAKFPDLNYSNGLEGDHRIAGAASAQVISSYTQCAGGSMTLTWSFGDPVDRTLTSHTQTISVLPDTEASWTSTPANITLKPNEVEDFLDTFTTRDLSYTNVGGTISGTATGTSSGSLEGCGSSMSVYWTFTDACGRKTEHTQTIEVEAAGAMPAWNNPPGNLTYSIAQATAFQPGSLSYSNNDQANLVEGIADPVTGGSFNGCGGTLSVNWSYTDACERLLSHTQTITVLPAPQAQFLNTPDDLSLTVQQADNFSAPALVCTNGLSGAANITATVAPVITRNYSSCGGSMTATWSFTDNCGRNTSYTQNISVNSTPIPNWINPPQNTTISCPDYQSYRSPVLSFSNNQNGSYNISGTVTAQVQAIADPCGSGFTETWSYTDRCGRTISHSRFVTVTATCDDGIQNQGEEDIDCGGPCRSCATCDDGIKNQDELGIDCGGPCAPCPSCPQPINLQAHPESSNRVTLNWNPETNMEEYLLRIRIQGNSNWYDFVTRDTSLSIRGLPANTNLEWQVRGNCTVIDSEWSDICVFNSSDNQMIQCDEGIRPPTCNDGIQNQGEEDIDCGGPCTACLTCDVPTKLFADQINADSAILYWSSVQNAQSYTLRVKMRDAGDWVTHQTTDTSFVLHGLIFEIEYDWQVTVDCGFKTGSWSQSCGFIGGYPDSGDCAPEDAPDPTCFDGKQNQGEDGIDCGGPCYRCPGCYAPTQLKATDIASSRVTLNWEGTEWDTEYQLRIRLQGATNWYDFSTKDTTLSIRGLPANTYLDWQVAAVCDLDNSTWSEICTFNSSDPNSGDCSTEQVPEPEIPNCRDGIQNQGESAIDCGGPCQECQNCKVDIPTGLSAVISRTSSADLSWEIVENAAIYSLRIRPAEESDWQVYETTQNSLPLDDLLPYKAYRWQVSAACTENTSDWSETCGFIAGEPNSGDCTIEEQPVNCPLPENPQTQIRILGSLNLVIFNWTGISEAQGYNIRLRQTDTEEWQNYSTGRTSLLLPRLPNGTYQWQIQTLCETETANWSELQTFTLDNPRLSLTAPESQVLPTGVHLYPNPANELLYIQLDNTPDKALDVKLFNFLGQQVKAQTMDPGTNRLKMTLNGLPGGVYFVQVDGQGELHRVVIQQ